jgi:chemotaxis signal transduction protein
MNTSIKSASAGEAVILFWIGPHKFAINAADVHEIREYDARWIARQKARKDAGVVTLHFAAELGLEIGKEQHILLLRGVDVGLAVGTVERMATARKLYALPSAFAGKEQEWYTGLLVFDGEVVPLVDGISFAFQSKVAVKGA